MRSVDKLLLKCKSRSKQYIILIIAVILFIGSTWQVAFSPGYVFLAEQFEVLNAHLFLRVTSLWPNTEIFSEADLGKLYLYWALYLLSFGDYKVLQVMALGLPSALAYLSATYLLSRFSKWGWAIAFLYVFNPLFINQPRDIQFRFEYALLPLALAVLIRVFEGRLIHGLVLAFILAMGSYRFYVLFAIMATLIFIWYIINKGKPSLVITTVAVTTGLILSLPRILPAIVHFLEGDSLALATFGVTERIRRVDVLDAFVLNYYYPGDVFEKITHGILNFGFFPSVLISIAVILRRRNNIVFLGALFVLVGILLTSTINIDPLLATFPPLARLLRQPYWNGIITLIGYLLLLSQLRSRIAIIAAVIIPAVFYGPIFFSGNMWGYWCASTPPQSYELLPSFEGKSLWIPTLGSPRAVWVKCERPQWASNAWGVTGEVEIRSWGGDALNVFHVSYLSQYFAYFNYFKQSWFPFALVTVDPRIAYGIVGISYVGMVTDRLASDDVQRSLWEARDFFSRTATVVINSRELGLYKLGDAPMCRAGAPLFLSGGYPALAVLYSVFGWRTPPVIFSNDNITAVQGWDFIQGDVISSIHFSSMRLTGLTKGSGIIYDEFYNKLLKLGSIWSYDEVPNFVYGYSGFAEGSIILPSGIYEIYVKGYVSNISGIITLTVGGKEYKVNLKSNETRFRWVHVGNFSWSGGRVDIKAVFSEGLVAVSELVFVRPNYKSAPDVIIITPYDIPGLKYRNLESPLGIIAEYNGSLKLPGNGNYIVYLHLISGSIRGSYGDLSNGSVVQGGEVLKFLNARVSYILLVRQGWKGLESVRNITCQDTFTVNNNELVQFNVLYDPFWRLKCDSQTYSPVKVFGLVNGFYVKTGGSCKLQYILYDVQKLAFYITLVYLFILTGFILVFYNKEVFRVKK